MTANINKLYTDAGFAPPDGKGIHTEAFHRCVVEVKKKLRDGKMKKTYVGKDGKTHRTSPHAICMAQLGVTGSVKKSHRRSVTRKYVK